MFDVQNHGCVHIVFNKRASLFASRVCLCVCVCVSVSAFYIVYFLFAMHSVFCFVQKIPFYIYFYLFNLLTFATTGDLGDICVHSGR